MVFALIVNLCCFDAFTQLRADANLRDVIYETARVSIKDFASIKYNPTPGLVNSVHCNSTGETNPAAKLFARIVVCRFYAPCPYKEKSILALFPV